MSEIIMTRLPLSEKAVYQTINEVITDVII